MRHLFFALKHEGTNLQVAILALKKIPGEALASAFATSPASGYARLACYLWEHAHGKTLEVAAPARGAHHKVFDEARYLTGPTQRNQRWRVDFNGIGTPRYCVTVERTPAIEALLGENTLDRVAEFLARTDQALIDRTVNWAYLSETESSYEIERERPSDSKAQAFARLLARAQEKEPITEEYLVALQNLAVRNPLDQASGFRTTQNRLRNDLRGALGVTYLPPPPECLPDVMDGIMHLANGAAAGNALDPLVLASLVSFAFVFAHPFMDGNGRISRFLFHKVACTDPRLRNGLVLPVSMAMKRHEREYLQALQSFSKPARALWKVAQLGDNDFEQEFLGDADIYRYWDATRCVEFGLAMASEALRHDLHNELGFLQRYDAVYRAVNDAVDMNNADMVHLVRSIVENSGTLSKNRRRQLIARGHPAEIIDRAETAAGAALESFSEREAANDRNGSAHAS
ncbi:MAG: Fic family protein [Proteobacteria bacterium]|nr:Fic family protein [Pseudomonadota bacterium]